MKGFTMKSFKKILVSTLAVVTMLSVAGFGMALQPVVAASAGDLIRTASSNAVYYLGSDAKRYVFYNGLSGYYPVYKTWYQNYNGVKTISDSELGGYALGGNVCVRPGTNLVMIKSDPKVYAVEKGCVLRHVGSEATAKAIWGNDWWKWVMEVPDFMFVNYTMGSELSSATYPSGSLVNMGGTVYVIEGMQKRAIASEAAFNANMFNWAYVLSASSLSGYSDGSSVTGYEAGLGTVAGPGVTPSTTGGSLSVFLAPDSPAPASVVGGAQRVCFTKIGLTATSSGAATVDSMVVRRTGLGSDAAFSDLILVDMQSGNQVGYEKSLGSTHEVTFNDDVEIPAGMTKYYCLAANMASSLSSYAGETPKLALASMVLKGGASVSGSFPIEGNYMTTNGSVSIGSITSASGGQTPAAQNKEVGTNDFIFTSERFTIGSVEDVNIESIRFYQNGTAADGDVKDLELLVDGAVVAGPVQVSNKEAVFNFVTPWKILKGNNKEVALRGDIVNGSSRTVNFTHEKKTDVRAKGLTYGFYLNPTYPYTTNPYFDPSDTTTIATGSLTVSKAVVSSSNVAEGVTGQDLGAFYLQAQGEPVQVSRLSMNFVVTGDGTPNAQDISNVRVLDSNGNVIAGPVDPSSSGQTATTTDTFVVPAGTSKYTIKGDLNTDFTATSTIAINLLLPGSYITAKGVSTNNTITPSPSTTVTLDTVSVKSGSLAVRTSSSPVAQTVIAGTTAFNFANFILDASASGEDVNVTQLLVRFGTSANSIQANITNLTLFDGATALNTPKTESNTAATAATSTITLLSPLKVAKGTTKTLALKGDISGSATLNQTYKFGLVSSSAATVTGAQTGTSITPSVTNSDGQLMTIATAGTLTVYNDGSNPLAGYLTANSTGNTVQVASFKADNEDIEIQNIGITIATVNGSNAQNNLDTLYLYNGSTLVGSVPVVGANATITPSSELFIPLNQTKNLTFKVDTKQVGPNYQSSGATFTYTITNYTVKGKSSGSTSVTTSGNPATNQLTIAKTVPSVTKGSVSGTLVSGSGVALGRFSVSANAKGDVGFYQAAFTLTTTTATVTNVKIYEDPDSSARDLTADAARGVSETLTAASGNPINGGVYGYNILFDYGQDGNSTNGTANGGEWVTIPAGGSRTYEIRGDVAGVTTGSSIVVQLRGDNAFPSTYPNTANGVDSDTNDNFIWSDLNFGNSSSTATQTLEWFNGYRILATTSLQTLSK